MIKFGRKKWFEKEQNQVVNGDCDQKERNILWLYKRKRKKRKEK